MGATWNPKHIQNVNMDLKSEVRGQVLDKCWTRVAVCTPCKGENVVFAREGCHRPRIRWSWKRYQKGSLKAPEIMTNVFHDDKITLRTSSQSGSTFQCKIFHSIWQKWCHNGVTMELSF